MIDYVHLKCEIELKKSDLDTQIWSCKTITNWDYEEEDVYQREINNVKIKYYSIQKQITLEGKIVRLLVDTHVQSVDDIYGKMSSVFVNDINAVLNRLFPRYNLDIRYFQVMRIDYCFSIKTEYVKEYIDFFNAAFYSKYSNTSIHFSKEQRKDGSVCIRPNSGYKDNKHHTYHLSFYDKLDWMQKKAAEGIIFTKSDYEAANNTLRLEVQCAYRLITDICNTMRISRKFGDFFHYDVAFNAVSMAYYRIFGGRIEHDYYSYEVAKSLIPPKKTVARAALYDIATNHNILNWPYVCKLIKAEGIYPYHLIPKETGIDHLDNPLKLIWADIDGLASTR